MTGQPPDLRAAEGPTMRRPRIVRGALGAVEVLLWAIGAVIILVTGIIMVLAFQGTIMETGRQMGGGLLFGLGVGEVDVVFTGVPLSVSWPYIVVMLMGLTAWLLLVLLIVGEVRCARRRTVRRRVTTRLLYVFAIIWSVTSFVFPFVLGSVRPAMAEAAGVVIPGVTFTYTMTMADMLSVLAGPLAVVVLAVLTSGRRADRASVGHTSRRPLS